MSLLKNKNNKIYLPEDTLIFEKSGTKIVTGVNPAVAEDDMIGDQVINPGDTVITTEGKQLVKNPNGSYTDLSNTGGGGTPSQWVGDVPGPIYYNDGNVGIGTSDPVNELDIVGSLASENVSIRVRNADSTGFASLSLNVPGGADSKALILRNFGSNFIGATDAGNSLSSASVFSAAGESGDFIFNPGVANVIFEASLVETMRISADAVTVNNLNVKNVADPVDAQDVATKNYVDTNGQIAPVTQTVSGSLVGPPQVFDQLFNFDENLYTSVKGLLEVTIIDDGIGVDDTILLYDVSAVYDSLVSNTWFSTLSPVVSNGQVPLGVSIQITPGGQLEYEVSNADISQITAKFRAQVL